MNLSCTNRGKPSIAGDYATSDDFRKLFTEDMEGLHLLAYLLTGDQEKAEQCFRCWFRGQCKQQPHFQRVGALLGSAHNRSKCNSYDGPAVRARGLGQSLPGP